MSTPGYAFISGAGNGIGKQCALAFADEGAAGIAICDLDIEAAMQTEDQCRAMAKNKEIKLLNIKMDVGEEKEVQNAVEQAFAVFGRIDYGINSAGLGVQTPAEISEASVSEFSAFMRVNVMGSMLFTRFLSNIMKNQSPLPAPVYRSDHAPRQPSRGVITLLGSCNSKMATPHIVQYVASKHAVLGIVKTAALDNAPHGIRVNGLCPSWVEGQMVDRAVAGNPGLGDLMKNAVPLRRLAQAQEVSDVVIFLSSNRASYITGASVMVDGGTTLQLDM
ncbi:hypothetical protein EDC01DRAFT_708354 [Geopyxis carbonaria]|nr:hypothetical protein EDC01DRAFT_708354 [Geopyxis carbonaria]